VFLIRDHHEIALVGTVSGLFEINLTLDASNVLISTLLDPVVSIKREDNIHVCFKSGKIISL